MKWLVITFLLLVSVAITATSGYLNTDRQNNFKSIVTKTIDESTPGYLEVYKPLKKINAEIDKLEYELDWGSGVLTTKQYTHLLFLKNKQDELELHGDTDMLPSH